MWASVSGAFLEGVAGHRVAVEVHGSNGLPSCSILGLPDAACREARDRVRAAFISCDLEWPNRRLTINLAPTNRPKHGAGLDVAIAIGVLAATGQIDPGSVEGVAFVGELGLDGTIRPVLGVAPLVHALRDRDVVVPPSQAGLASVVHGGSVRSAPDLGALVAALRGEMPWPTPPEPDALGSAESAGESTAHHGAPQLDLAEVVGQPMARRAAEVAAAGGHNLLLFGPPGSGKTMLARRLVGLLPDLDAGRSIETTLVHSAAGLAVPAGGLVVRPPFRAPHHGVSTSALVGGGTKFLAPGEVSKAHNGVLFLDELGEFVPSALDALRQPLEEGEVRVSRAERSAVFPARVLMVAAMNPCPCGEAGRPGACRCSEVARARYARRVSGPLLDWFDLRLLVGRPEVDDLLRVDEPGESSAAVAARVAVARRRAEARGIGCNAELTGRTLRSHAVVTPEGDQLLRRQLELGTLSARGLDRVRAVALTLADLADDEPVLTGDRIAAALGLRVESRRVLDPVAA